MASLPALLRCTSTGGSLLGAEPLAGVGSGSVASPLPALPAGGSFGAMESPPCVLCRAFSGCSYLLRGAAPMLLDGMWGSMAVAIRYLCFPGHRDACCHRDVTRWSHPPRPTAGGGNLGCCAARRLPFPRHLSLNLNSRGARPLFGAAWRGQSRPPHRLGVWWVSPDVRLPEVSSHDVEVQTEFSARQGVKPQLCRRSYLLGLSVLVPAWNQGAAWCLCRGWRLAPACVPSHLLVQAQCPLPLPRN